SRICDLVGPADAAGGVPFAMAEIVLPANFPAVFAVSLLNWPAVRRRPDVPRRRWNRWARPHGPSDHFERVVYGSLEFITRQHHDSRRGGARGGRAAGVSTDARPNARSIRHHVPRRLGRRPGRHGPR